VSNNNKKHIKTFDKLILYSGIISPKVFLKSCRKVVKSCLKVVKKLSQKLFFATMRKKRQENAENPANVTFCHNNAQKEPPKC
jgi:hypothetical protein